MQERKGKLRAFGWGVRRVAAAARPPNPNGRVRQDRNSRRKAEPCVQRLLRSVFRAFAAEWALAAGSPIFKRFNVLPEQWKLPLTIGDFELFERYITEADVERIASFGMDHIRLGFDQIVVEESPSRYRESVFGLIETFVKACEKRGLNVVLNLHKAIGNSATLRNRCRSWTMRSCESALSRCGWHSSGGSRRIRA